MATSEFELIHRYFTRLGKQGPWLSIGIGDDAAVITPQAGQQLLISIDTLNAGIHFPEQTSPADIGYKALAVNLSDIAAMGGEPQWFTLSISLPSADEVWLEQFCQGMTELVEQYRLCLVGGDTTRGPLSVTIQIAGNIPTQQALTRAGAQVGDDIYVTGTLGDAAAGLMICQDQLQGDAQANAYFVNKLHRPVPRITIGQGLRGLANACIDVSDGLAADLGHIIEDSGVGAVLSLDSLPLSNHLRSLDLPERQRQRLILFAGDDYELCFTAKAKHRAAIQQLAATCDVPITLIGSVIEEPGLFSIEKGRRTRLQSIGYNHFQTE